jgi:hypothetical protein
MPPFTRFFEITTVRIPPRDRNAGCTDGDSAAGVDRSSRATAHAGHGPRPERRSIPRRARRAPRIGIPKCEISARFRGLGDCRFSRGPPWIRICPCCDLRTKESGVVGAFANLADPP